MTRPASATTISLCLFLASFVAASVVGQSNLRFVDHNSIPGQVGHSMAYDEVRDRVVLFGKGQTWLWDGHVWTQQAPANSPSARTEAAMAFDPTRQRVVLFGGSDSGGAPLADTWEWDGQDWLQMTPVTIPAARAYHTMAYDPVGSRVLCYGGKTSWQSNAFMETWSWDGVDWLQLSPSNPSAVQLGVMTTDFGRQRIVLFGEGQTWEWDGTDWLQLLPANNPSAFSSFLEGPAIAYDSSRQLVVLHGTVIGPMGDILPTTWEWDGADWVHHQTGSGPSPMRRQLASDTTRGHVVGFGGSRGGSGSPNGPFYSVEPAATWISSIAGWTRASTCSGYATSARGLAVDTVRGRIVSFDTYPLGQTVAGSITGVIQYETFTREWDGAKWLVSQPATQPSPMRNNAAVFDSWRGVTIVFGGENSNQMWQWDGTTWSPVSTAVLPPGRQQHAMAFDEQRGVTVLFGGAYYPGMGTTLFGDTWEWDGLHWLQHNTATAPSARHGHGLSHDPIRGRTVLYGGMLYGSIDYNDTWEWDGSQWAQILAPTQPPGGGDLPLAWDPVRQRTVLYAGDSLWDFDGIDWTQRTANPPLPNSLGGAMVFDFTRNTLLVSEGHTTRLIGNVTVPQVVTLGPGCSGQSTAPTLSAPAPAIGTDNYTIALDGTLGNAAAAFLLSTSDLAIPFGNGCTWHASNNPLIAPLVTSNFGHADVTVTIPFSTALRGFQVYAQALAFDPMSPPFGVAFSTALALRIGD